MTTTGTWYPPPGLTEQQYDPAAGSGGFLINPPFATMNNDQHPITPPPELVVRWAHTAPILADLATQAARWGADQELEACCELLEISDTNAREFLTAARRPKPPSLKELALQALESASYQPGSDFKQIDPARSATIRRALEALPE